MVAILSKVITLYIGPVLYITSLFLSIFAFLAPVPVLHSAVSLAIVYPATPVLTGTAGIARRDEMLQALGRKIPRAELASQVLAAKVDGPTVRMGPLGKQQHALSPCP